MQGDNSCRHILFYPHAVMCSLCSVWVQSTFTHTNYMCSCKISDYYNSEIHVFGRGNARIYQFTLASFELFIQHHSLQFSS